MPANLSVTTPSDLEIVMTRVFDAPAKLLFDCHTKPEYVKRWLLGPPGWSMPVCDIDLRVGGRYRFLWRSDDKSAEFGSQGVYREIVEPTRVVNTESMDGWDGESINTLAFSESDGKTTLVSSMLFASKEVRDQALQSGMSEGVAASYDRLEDFMKEKVG